MEEQENKKQESEEPQILKDKRAEIIPEPKSKKTFSEWYNENYKKLLLIPLILLILSLGYIGYFYSQNKDFIKKDVSLTGGTTITIFSEGINIGDLEQSLSEREIDFSIRQLSDFRTKKQQAIVIESQAEVSELRTMLEEVLGFELTEENSTIEFSGSSLSTSFYRQLQIAILFSFLLMATVVFVIFRKFVTSGAVVLSAFADIIMTLALVNFLGITVSSAGIIAFLMLIGYSVDTDIMLTTRLLKRKESELNQRMFEAFKTGITMTLSSIAAVGVALIFTISFSAVLSQIFTILLIGLGFDLLNTWITNASLLKWYLEKKQ